MYFVKLKGWLNFFRQECNANHKRHDRFIQLKTIIRQLCITNTNVDLCKSEMIKTKWKKHGT